MEKYLTKGHLGHYGKYKNNKKNIIVMEVNKLVDEYNEKINKFPTKAENDIFHQKMISKIKELYYTIEKFNFMHY